MTEFDKDPRDGLPPGLTAKEVAALVVIYRAEERSVSAILMADDTYEALVAVWHALALRGLVLETHLANGSDFSLTNEGRAIASARTRQPPPV